MNSSQEIPHLKKNRNSYNDTIQPIHERYQLAQLRTSTYTLLHNHTLIKWTFTPFYKRISNFRNETYKFGGVVGGRKQKGGWGLDGKPFDDLRMGDLKSLHPLPSTSKKNLRGFQTPSPGVPRVSRISRRCCRRSCSSSGMPGCSLGRWGGPASVPSRRGPGIRGGRGGTSGSGEPSYRGPLLRTRRTLVATWGILVEG